MTSPLGAWDGLAYTGILGWVASAYNYTAWDGPGIAATTADALIGVTAVGEARDALFISGTENALFDGQTVDATTVIVKYTYSGDLNFDGSIDRADYGTIDNYVQFPGTSGYVNGDFNYDGIIDGADYGLIDNAIQLQGEPL
jgi:hypothetical protein